MKIISWNVNGLRNVYRRRLLEWLGHEDPDIVCLQEIKTQRDQLSKELLEPLGYRSYFNSAKKKGYSGVCVFSKVKPQGIKRKFGISRFDNEGRFLQLKFPNFILINLYIPHGDRTKKNLDYKLEVYDRLIKKIRKMRSKKVILIGDFNIAHKEIDLARPKQNKDNIMFTLKEREQIDRIVDLGFVDSFRQFDKKGGNFTWLSYFKDARQKGLGWRIDYVFVSKSSRSKLKRAYILNNTIGSDHCPIGVELRV